MSTNNVLNSPNGIDQTVQSIQLDLYRELKNVWSGDIDGYGRVYKNIENSTDDIPKYYKSAKSRPSRRGTYQIEAELSLAKIRIRELENEIEVLKGQ